MLEASLLPTPEEPKGGPFVPPGHAPSYPVTLVSGVSGFLLSPLAPCEPSEATPTPTPTPSGQLFKQSLDRLLRSIRSAAQSVIDFYLKLVGKACPILNAWPASKMSGFRRPTTSPMNMHSCDAHVLPLTLNYHFRILPLKDGGGP